MRNGHVKHGFTLIELLVVVAILSLLLAILSPVLRRAKELTRRIICAAQLHELGGAMTAYGAGNGGRLPSHAGDAGNWLWDLNNDTVRAMMNYGASRDVFYCPANPMLTHDDFWLDGRFSGYIVAGYCWLIRHPGPGGALAGGPTMLNDQKWQDGTSPPDPDAPLVFDPVVMAWWLGRWTDFGHRDAGATSHMDPAQPAGGNILHMDGQVGWKLFEDMTYNARFGPDTFW